MIRYQAFCKIMEYGSFTRAADSLGYTQAAVSQMIQSLEAEVDTKLLVRSRSEVRLTPEGQQLYPFILRVVSAAREMNDKAGEIRGLESGEVRIGIWQSVSQFMLPRLLKAFTALHPGIRFTLFHGDNKTLPALLRSGVVDIAFVYPQAATGLTFNAVATEQFLAVLPEKHPLAQSEPVPLQALAQEPLIVMEEGTRHNTTLEAFAALNETPNVRFRIQDDTTTIAMVEQNLGVSLIPSMSLEHKAYRFKKLSTTPTVQRVIGIAYESPVSLTVATKAFLNFMYANLPSLLNTPYVTCEQVKPIE